MPAAFRPSRSLLALALVANLFAASVPVGAGAAEQGGDGSATTAAQLARASVGERETSGAAVDTTSAVGSTGEAGTTDVRPQVLGPRPVGVAKATKAGAAGSGSTSAASYKGRNHVWIPALGLSKGVTFYSCSSTAYPGNRVYRWGCAGSNNVYLFGHAHSVFRALHDAYVRGRLFKGMNVYYANGAGKVATYAVSWWKLTTPDKGAWAYAAQSTPSLTLQTCVGANSQYRLIVRLRKVG
jgi:sortase family protein